MPSRLISMVILKKFGEDIIYFIMIILKRIGKDIYDDEYLFL